MSDHDHNHRLLVEEWIKFSTKFFSMKYSDKNKQSIELEYPYSHYGNRGFVDVFIVNRDVNSCSIALCECKPSLMNFGEGIRQLRKAESVVFKGGFSYPYERGAYKVFLILVTIFNDENYKILKTLYNTILHLPDNFYFALYFQSELPENATFKLFDKKYFAPEYLEKHGDILDRWQALQSQHITLKEADS